ncbi:helix-turn-helix domain-containing protein [Parahaliea mediterranea]|uniref:Helix-turn-helix transcriptional regulator n=1 Tax=Parahaliea mediterranea TaxID=651086 RepID=A0A939IJR2_9GAMM|nr:helix-turn-helix transcriptional regulator [Parahaliea mediterranea]MBN7796561.1 helix-turn-helix transcriptional regulator [Parahaliea mediterranea]
MANSGDPGPAAFGRMLKFWRGALDISQEELAHRIESASRYISRLEKGDARPSKEMVERIAGALSLGLRDTTNLLLAAGYTDYSRSLHLDQPEFQHRREELLLKLKALDPHPSLLVDMTGQILMVNRAWAALQAQLDPERRVADTGNIFGFLFDYAALNALPQQWSGTLSVLMLSLQQLLFLQGDEDESVLNLLRRLESSPYAPANWATQAAARDAGQQFQANLLVAGKVHSFVIHSHIENLLGPLVFSSVPNMAMMTFTPRDEELDLVALLAQGGEHPLLLY